MKLETLNVIQNELRNIHQLEGMIDFVIQGGIFDGISLEQYHTTVIHKPKDLSISGLIEIAHFPDDAYYLHNGHHRAVAIYLAGRDHLHKSEYYIKEWDYSDYNTIAFLDPSNGKWRGYVTPIDIRVEARRKDIGFYKKFVKEIYVKLGVDAAIKHIKNSKDQYAMPKLYHSVPELALSINEHIPRTPKEERNELINSSVD